ncbi:hypothetical protein [Corallococcus sicarius]|uniref:Uncharacterized protein n=1 Tax=Corallococcus sicarius TaxID=2316726 RepID=A0A3A8NBK1_9BACT|nr:hypothetical protein [Corallococcus sicarius]RKH41686.1 hypothetical protein D7X12_17755 [Corallococcus sicarius]
MLFTQEDTSYEFFRNLGVGRLGERVLLAFVRTPQGLGENQLWDIEVPDDEDGIAVPLLDTPHPDDVTTVPGPGVRPAGSRPSTG